jgi:hypothetical protein
LPEFNADCSPAEILPLVVRASAFKGKQCAQPFRSEVAKDSRALRFIEYNPEGA